jgi:hypothetical protein
MTGNQDITPEMISTMAGGIGSPATMSYIEHCKFLIDLPQYENPGVVFEQEP